MKHAHPSDKNKDVRWIGHSFISRGSATTVENRYKADLGNTRQETVEGTTGPLNSTVTTVMSSVWPKPEAASAMRWAGKTLSARVRSKPNSSPGRGLYLAWAST